MGLEREVIEKMDRNKLFFGDNLDILRNYIKDESVDLIYLDPPFNSNKIYNVIYSEENGTPSKSQMQAFDDTWCWNEHSALAFQLLMEGGHEKVNNTMSAFREMLGECNLLAYLTMMASRLIEMHRVLKKTGSLYLHCDPTASHYLKILLDSIFLPRNYQNELVWCYRERELNSRKYNPKHDIILYYVKNTNSDYVFNNSRALTRYSNGTIEKFNYTDENGRKFQIRGKGSPYTKKQGLSIELEKDHPELVYRDYFDKAGGVSPRDWLAPPMGNCYCPKCKNESADSQIYFSDQKVPSRYPFAPINRAAQERMGYPTQKPESLLKYIVGISSNEGDVILDPFCGCGTTVSVAEQLKRKWIGIDITYLAIALINNRLQTRFTETNEYDIVGVPTSLNDAKALALHDRYQFQTWVILLANAFPRQKKGSDRGIDGFLNFHDDNSGKTKKILIQVKSGKVKSGDIRDLVGTVEREKAVIGVFITLEKPTSHMVREATSAGFYKTPFVRKPFPKIQLLTVEEILNGKQIDYPFPEFSRVGMKKAPRFIDKDLMPSLFDKTK
ncbi:MAG: DNA methyltransferase [Candidatus Hatepunaea meridiana]|nr:DNA methyltransferase [Candidatus Hatepunaea meridiana]